jgi:hypothetical protein
VIHDVLYASKSLAQLWLPDAFSSPFLDRGPNGRVEWFWRVDVNLVAWATRMMAKARAARAEIPGNPERRLRLLREHLESLDPGSLLRVDTLATAPVKLPGDELILDANEFARWGWVPRAG